MYKKKTKVLVTGGAGFIGSHLLPVLLEKGYDVTVFDNLRTGKLQNLTNPSKNHNFHFIQGDIRDLKELQQASKDIQAVIHLAAQIDVAASVNNPIETHQINTTGTFNVLQVAAENHHEKFVLASSTAVYGDTSKLPITEDTPLNPLSPYAASKAAGEAYCRAFSQCFNLSTTVLRFFNVYGKGNENNPYSGVITKFLQKVQNNQPLTIEGDGEQTRDFIHVSDVVNALVQALQYKKANYDVFNLCTGVPTTINQLVSTIAEAKGKNLNVTHAQPRIGDIRKNYGNPTKAIEKLGFKSNLNLKTGLFILSEELQKQQQNRDSPHALEHEFPKNQPFP
jgi:UDP-glucose 4-epimerase